MTQRILTHDGQSADDARRLFDSQLGVSAWAVPGRLEVGTAPVRDPRAPWWWDSAEEASDSFLTAMGVTL